MVSKSWMLIISFFKKLYFKLKYGNSIIFNGLIKVLPNVKILNKNGKIIFGSCVSIMNNVTISCASGNIKLGDRVFINRNCIFVSRDSITIGQGTCFGPNVCIYDHNHKFNENGVIPGEFRTGAVNIGDECWIGAGCIILKGTTIGSRSIIGAGTVVSGNIPEGSIVTMDRNLIVRKLEKQ